MPEPTSSSIVANGTPGDLFVHAASSQAGNVFLQSALAQEGDVYVFGHEVEMDDANPEVFDCSELVQWAAAQAGVEVTDGSWLQYRAVAQQGGVMSVEEALRTPGALLFRFSGDPTAGGRPSSAHVAISLGDGRTIEARGTSYGVGTFDAEGRGWTHAGVLPELSGAVLGSPPVIEQIDPYGDSDGDGILDRYEALIGSDPFNRDTDGDGFVDSVELIDYGTDPLDPTDNARDDQLVSMGLEPIGQAGSPGPEEGATSTGGSTEVPAQTTGDAGGQGSNQEESQAEPPPETTNEGADSTVEGEDQATDEEAQSSDEGAADGQQTEPAEGDGGPGEEQAAATTSVAAVASGSEEGEEVAGLDLSTDPDGLDELVITGDGDPFLAEDPLVSDVALPDGEL